MTSIRIGTAGWSLGKTTAELFSAEGTHLERYASRLGAVEINSSFYRAHRRSTYERWADSMPDQFRFSVKLPKQITHVNRLENSETELEQFLSAASGLGDMLGPILVQLPPSLAWNEAISHRFFSEFRACHNGSIVCEPRHKSWFTDEVDRHLNSFRIGRVAADPAVVSAAAIPGGLQEECYFRWHGSPHVYYSVYDDQALVALANTLRLAAHRATSIWCIFDNTAENAAIPNALTLGEMLKDE